MAGMGMTSAFRTSVRSLGHGQVTIRAPNNEENCIIFPVKPDDYKWFHRFIFVEIDTLPPPTDYLFNAWRSTTGFFQLPKSPDEVESLTRLFGPPPAHRTFTNLIRDFGRTDAEEEDIQEQETPMSSGPSKPRASLEMLLAQRRRKAAEGARKPAEKRRTDSVSASESSPRKRSTTGSSAETIPAGASPLAATHLISGSLPLTSSASGPAFASGSASILCSPAVGDHPETVLRFPENFGKAKTPGNLGLLNQLLLPGPRSVLASRSLDDLADRAAEHSFEAMQMTLFFREKVSGLENGILQLQAEKAQLLDQAKADKEEKLKMHSDLDSSQNMLMEEVGRKQKLQVSLAEAQNQITQDQEDKSSLASEVQALKAQNSDLKRSLLDAFAFASQETRIKCIEEFQAGEHLAWDLEAERARLAEDFPEKPDLDMLMDDAEDPDGSAPEEEVTSAHSVPATQAPAELAPAAEVVEHVLLE